MSSRLIAVAGPLSGTSLPLSQPEVFIGRDEDNQVALADPSVSPRHCVFASAGNRVTIRSLDRDNPTFVNGLPVEERPLENGDELQIGGSLFVVRLSDREQPSPDAVRVGEERPAAPAATVLTREAPF